MPNTKTHEPVAISESFKASARELLDRAPILHGLKAAQLDAILPLLKQQRFPMGETIFKRGGPASHIYLVWEGQVGIRLVAGVEVLQKATLDPGQCFGETSVIGSQPHTADAFAATDARLLVITRDALVQIHHQDCEVFAHLLLNIARESCRRLAHTDSLFLSYLEYQKQKETL